MPSTRSLHPTRVPRSSLAFGLLLSLVAACGAKPPGDIETSTAALSAGPLTFYTPYEDTTPFAPINGGASTPRETNLPFLLAPGRFGQALKSETELLSWAKKGSSDLARPGSLAFWLKPDHWVDAQFPLIVWDGSHKLVVMANVGRFFARFEDWSRGEVPDQRGAEAFIGDSSGWGTDSSWHLVVISWGVDYLAVSLDGAPQRSTPVPWWPELGTSDDGWIYAGGGKAAGFLRDELMVLNRPMRDDEIAWLWNTRTLPSTSPNPALNYFRDLNVCATANDGQTATLTCPAGTVIKTLDFASYGTPTGACGAFVKSTCSANNSWAVASGLCLGKTSCSVAAATTTFGGDPCSGTPKQLALQATCERPAVPSAPLGLQATLATTSRVDLTWIPVSNVIGHFVERVEEGGSATKISGDLPATATTFSDSTVVLGKRYDYRVYAFNQGGPSLPSEAVSVSVTVPAAPANLAATVVKSTQVDLTWSDVPTNESSYRIERSTDGTTFTFLKSVGAGITKASDTTVPAVSNVYYRVQAVNVVGSSPFAGPLKVGVSTPTAPTTLTGLVSSPTAIGLMWLDKSSNETGFKVERSTDNGTTFTQIGTTKTNQAVFADTGRTAGASYVYRVRAYNGVGNSAYSNTLTIAMKVPATPTGLTATMTSASTINLKWTDAANNETGYIVALSMDGTNFVDVATLPGNATSYTDEGLEVLFRYSYRVRAINGIGASANSNTAAVDMLPPLAPANLKAAVVSKTQINLTWTDTANEAGYRIERQTDGGGWVRLTGVPTAIANPAAGATSFSDSTVIETSAYRYRVFAFNPMGESVPPAVAPPESAAAVQPTLPKAPSSLKAFVVSTAAVDVTWKDNATNETDYTVSWVVGTTTTTKTFAANSTKASLTGLPSSTSLTFKVTARNGVGSASASVSTKTSTPTAAPTALTAQAVSGSTIKLAWSESASNESGFIVERSNDGSTNWQALPADPALRPAAGQNATSFTDTALPPKTKFFYRVRATNGAGASANAGPVSATTLALCVNDANGTPCNDGSLCSTGDTCQAGSCVGQAVVCPAADACVSWACAPATGQCVATQPTPGVSCPICGSGADNDTATVACPAGRKITAVTFASYGTPEGACGSFAMGTCHATDSLAVVSRECVGKTSCSVDVSNDAFGDPCAGTPKRLAFQVACSDGNEPQDLTYGGSIIASVTAPTGSGSRDLEIIRDGDLPPVGSINNTRQYDTFNGDFTRTEDWVGYQFPALRTFRRVVFQEGMHFGDGGWFDSLHVQVRQGSTWMDVPGVTIAPPYSGPDSPSFPGFRTFQLDFLGTGTALRIQGPPGGSSKFISVGELHVFGEPPAEDAPTAESITPIVTCVMPNSIGGTTALFGYQTTATENVYLRAGSGENELLWHGSTPIGTVVSQFQPSWFMGKTGASDDGIRHAVLAVDFGTSVEWDIGRKRTFANPGNTCVTNDPSCPANNVKAGGKCWPLPMLGTGIPSDTIAATEKAANGFAAAETDGSLSVTHDGTASYTLPLALPAGKAGFTPPALALSYSSGGANGIAGTGFSLTGASQLHRCPMHPVYGDPKPAAVKWDESHTGSNDPYGLCLDGRRLIRNQADLFEFRFEDDPVARLRITSQFPDSTPKTFELRHGDGVIYRYGETDASRVSDHLTEYNLTSPRGFSEGVSAQPSVYAWSLSSVENRYGQIARYEYQTKNTTTPRSGVEHYLTRITYEGASVELDYRERVGTTIDELKERPDPTQRYVRGMRFLQRRRLWEVRTKVGTQIVSTYKLGYEQGVATGRSRLVSFQECDRGNVCKAPLKLTWQDLTEADQKYQGRFDIVKSADGTRLPLDIGFEVAQAPNVAALQVVDINHDGRDDILLRRQEQSTGQRAWWYALSNGDGFDPLVKTDLPVGFSTQTAQGFLWTVQKWKVFRPILISDLDGDGVPEFGLWEDALNGYKFFRNAGGAHFEAVPSLATTKGVQPYVGDMNGDGLPELVQYDATSNKYRVWVNSTATPGVFSVASSFIQDGNPAGGGDAFVMDVDGDGTNEFVVQRTLEHGPDAMHAPVFAAADPAPTWTTPAFVVTRSGRSWFFDADGDGLVDEASVDSLSETDGVVPDFYDNTGNGFRTHQAAFPGTAYGDAVGWRFGESGVRLLEGDEIQAIDNGVRVADLDGDGRQELLVLGDLRSCWTAPDTGTCVGTLTPRKPFMVKQGYDGTWQKLPIPGLELGVPVERVRRAGERPRYAGYTFSTTLDVDGDGVTDFLQPELVGNTYHLKLYRRASKMPDLLLGITSSLGANTSISYRPMIDSEVARAATTSCSYPLSCPHAGGWLVSSVTSDTSAATRRTEEHTYHDPRVALSGRGWLGFAEHTVRDVARGSFVTSFMDNTTQRGRFFPFAGVVGKQRGSFPIQTAGDPPSLFSRFLTMETEVTDVFLDNDVSHVYRVPQRVCERKYQHKVTDLPASTNLFAEVCTDYKQYDSLGFPKVIDRMGTRGLEALHQETTYEHRPETAAKWIVGIVRNVKTTSTITGSDRPPVTREVQFDDIDAFGQPLTETMQPNASPTDPPLKSTRKYTYNQQGQLLTETVIADANGPLPGDSSWTPQIQKRTSTFAYDSFGYPRIRTNPLGHREELKYEPTLGVLAAYSNPNGVVTRYTYDGFGRPREQRNPRGADTILSYSGDATNPLIVTATLAHREGGTVTETLAKTITRLDPLGHARRQESIEPRGRTTFAWTRYDALGRVVGVSNPQFSADEAAAAFTTLEYDGLDRVVSRKDADGVVSERTEYDGLTTTIYDAKGNDQTIFKDPRGYAKFVFDHDKNGEPTGQIQYKYAPFGQVAKVSKTLNQNKREDYETWYDDLGRPNLALDPDRRFRQMVYNGFGELIQSFNAAGQPTFISLDFLGRQTSVVNEDGVTRFEYDTAPAGVGALASMTSPDGIETTHRFDGLGRPIGEIVAVPSAGQFAFDRTYDRAGRVDRLSYPAVPGRARFNVGFVYSTSAGAALKQVVDPANKTIWQAEEFDAFGGVSQEVFANSMRVRRARDPITGVLSSIKGGFVTDPFFAESGGGTAPGFAAGVKLTQEIDYEYDAARNVSKRHDRGSLAAGQIDESYEYDAYDRLEHWTIDAPGTHTKYKYDFDDSGNLFHRVVEEGSGQSWSFEYASPLPHAVTTSTVNGIIRSHEYDQRGRRFKSGNLRVDYNAFDLPKTITDVEFNKSATFEYDAAHARTRKTTKDTEFLTIALYERRRPLVSGGTKHIFRVPGAGGVVAEVEWEQAGASFIDSTRYLHEDRLGSVELVSNSIDHTVARQRFEPYGGLVDPANPAAAVDTAIPGERSGFTGHEQDLEFGLINMRGRMYDPFTAAFLSPDPFVTTDPSRAHAFNAYSYVLHNPLNATDPSGFKPDGISLTGLPPPGKWVAVPTAEDRSRPNFWINENQEVVHNRGPAVAAPTPQSPVTGGGGLTTPAPQGGGTSDQERTTTSKAAEQKAAEERWQAGNQLLDDSLSHHRERSEAGRDSKPDAPSRPRPWSTVSSCGGGGRGHRGSPRHPRRARHRKVEPISMDFGPRLDEPRVNYDNPPFKNGWGAGVELDGAFIFPTSGGGGQAGLNIQYTSDNGWELFKVLPGAKQARGVNIGWSLNFNFALGHGSWEGPFENRSFAITEFGFTHFQSSPDSVTTPGQEYVGVAVGFGKGPLPLPVSVSYCETNYVKVQLVDLILEWSGYTPYTRW